MLLHLSSVEMLWVLTAVVVAYVIFGVAGFGSALVLSPLLANFMPVSKIVPLLALLDLFAALNSVIRDGKNADLSELKRLIPFMVMGSLIGVVILMRSRPDFLLLALALFVIAYSLHSLAGFHSKRKFSASSAMPFGLIGGVFSAVFGSGGFLYAIYLSGRLESKERFRVTQATVIGLSTLTRLLFFIISGAYADSSILLMALMLAPAMVIGIFVGRRMTLRLSRDQFIRFVDLVILLSGVFLLFRYLGR